MTKKEILKKVEELEERGLIWYNNNNYFDAYEVIRWNEFGCICQANKEYPEKRYYHLIDIGTPSYIYGARFFLTPFIKRYGEIILLDGFEDDLDDIESLLDDIEALAAYPILDEDRYSELESEVLSKAIEDFKQDNKEYLQGVSDESLEEVFLNLGHEYSFAWDYSERDIFRALGIEREAI